MYYRRLAIAGLIGIFSAVSISTSVIAQEGVGVGRREEIIKIRQEIRRHREVIKGLLGQLRQLGGEYREEKKDRHEETKEERLRDRYERREDLGDRREEHRERMEDLRGKRGEHREEMRERRGEYREKMKEKGAVKPRGEGLHKRKPSRDQSKIEKRGGPHRSSPIKIKQKKEDRSKDKKAPTRNRRPRR